jgi:hypothetical protein
LSIHQAKGLKVCKAQELTQQSCQTFYNNLQLLYNKKNYPTYHTWNNDEIKIQASKQARAKMLAKGGSQQVYRTI